MTRPRHASLATRLLDCFPSGSYALSALLRLVDIVETDSIPTAAVECRLQPRLLVNPGFVADHAETPEKLLMLVMHELHHVLLGHTTLFPTVTRTRNFVFDCVINALLARMFPEPGHLAFLTDYYSDARFPECLLRPAAGWPALPDAVPPGIAALADDVREPLAAIHRALYSEAGATYHEVYEALPKLIPDGAVATARLLGDHAPDGATAGGLDTRSPLLFDVVRQIVEKWPQPPDPIRGRSLADVLEERRVAPRQRPSARATLRALLHRVAEGAAAAGSRRRGASPCPSTSPLPTLDRRAAVLRALGTEPLLYPSTIESRRWRPSGERVHVYLDVSGSVDAICGALYGAVLDCAADVHPTVHLFSSRVADVSLAELRAGVRPSTGGTDVACVAAHLREHRIRRALVVTDGWVGTPAGRDRATLAATRLAVAYVGPTTHAGDLDAVANHSARIAL